MTCCGLISLMMIRDSCICTGIVDPAMGRLAAVKLIIRALESPAHGHQRYVKLGESRQFDAKAKRSGQRRLCLSEHDYHGSASLPRDWAALSPRRRRGPSVMGLFHRPEPSECRKTKAKKPCIRSASGCG